MISITLRSGPFIGTTKVIGKDISPESFFHELFLSGWRWEVDYSQASIEEQHRWFPVDLASRCARTICNGLPVKFLGKLYQADQKNKAEQFKLICELEEAIVASGNRPVTIERDDDNGVIIGMREYKQ